MKSLKIGILDVVQNGPTKALYARVMNANLASIMPQVVGTWCEQAGHDVRFITYTGFENLLDELPADMDVLFVSAFTEAAQLAYALSNLFQQRGAVTVLGGPHARCYPDDALKYFDYVLGFTDKRVVEEVLNDCSPHRPLGLHLAAKQQPRDLPGVRERWKFIELNLKKSPTPFKVVPMIGSLGCPYTCSFCIDAEVAYQPLDYETIKEDLKFLLTKIKSPIVGWHDPNFGIRFNDYLGVIEEADPDHRFRFIAESSLALLAEKNLKRLAAAGFQAILPGIESWYTTGNKSKTGRKQAMDKVEHVSEHVNMILRYLPYVQTNFVVGMDEDEGPEPFELTKTFLDKSPGAFPAYSMLTAFGEAAPLNLQYQRDGRVLPSPFHFVNNNHAMNVKPKNYSWPDFYDRLIDLSMHSFSWKAIYRRTLATRLPIPRWMNFVRAVSSEGFGRIRYHKHVRGLLDTDTEMRDFFEGETDVVPQFYVNRMKRDLGPLWDALPEGALQHDPNAYLKKTAAAA